MSNCCESDHHVFILKNFPLYCFPGQEDGSALKGPMAVWSCNFRSPAIFRHGGGVRGLIVMINFHLANFTSTRDSSPISTC